MYIIDGWVVKQTQVASLMDKYAEYLDDADDASGESTKMMREAMAHTQVRCCGVLFVVCCCFSHEPSK